MIIGSKLNYRSFGLFNPYHDNQSFTVRFIQSPFYLMIAANQQRGGQGKRNLT